MLSRTVASPAQRYHWSSPLSKVSTNLLNKLRDLHTYLNDDVLTYVITLPVVSGKTFGVIKLIAISIALENMEFLYIEREESILCLDQNRLYYLMIDEAEMYHCKTTTT